jgi:pimeloyl-ACP methyl ester carboxylesterase
VAVATLAAALGAAGPAAAQGPLLLAPCEQPRGAECGTLTVPLDHGGQVPGTLPLRFVRYRATQGPARGTLVFVAGGPGQPGIPLAETLREGPLEGVARSFDLVVVDQRGAGRSGALACSVAPRGVLELQDAATLEDVVAAVGRCGEELGERRRFFSTAETAFDLEDLRRALGLERIAVLGSSYGGQVAGEYVRRFPAATQAVVLDATSPIEGVDALSVLPGLALPRVLRELCFPPGCEELFAAPTLEQLGALAERLEERPLRGRVVLPSGRRERATLTAADVYALVRASDLDPFLRTELPAAIAAGNRGDAAPLLRLARRLGAAGGEPPELEEADNEVRLLATDCIEGRLPWSPASAPAGRTQALESALAENPGVYAPFGLEAVAGQLAATLCLGWPATPEPAQTGGRGPDVPVLVLGGREDLRTPLEDQRRAAGQFPSAQVLAVPDAGHTALGSDLTGCASAAVLAFLEGRPVQRCARGERMPDLALPVPRGLADLRGGPVRRTTSAVQLTLLDAARQILALTANLEALAGAEQVRIPGLRGGRIEIGRRGVRLRAYEFVTGVRLDGSLRTRGASRFTVTGAGAEGIVRVDGKGELTGTLDGRQVRADLGGEDEGRAVARAARVAAARLR